MKLTRINSIFLFSVLAIAVAGSLILSLSYIADQGKENVVYRGDTVVLTENFTPLSDTNPDGAFVEFKIYDERTEFLKEVVYEGYNMFQVEVNGQIYEDITINGNVLQFDYGDKIKDVKVYLAQELS